MCISFHKTYRKLTYKSFNESNAIFSARMLQVLNMLKFLIVIFNIDEISQEVAKTIQ